ncbi:5-formyltetrahydrofolate cyclo-ligase [Candidatus Peregrinibacteria bacterium]|nr:5-formyltetrahydrofolate cyclo-ligase [Candidatus Peregrinibacteria bacterium]
MNQKEKIRQKAVKFRNNLSEGIRQAKSRLIAKSLEQLSYFQEAKNILFYHSFSSEVDTIVLLNNYYKTKNLFLPQMVKGFIEPARFYGEPYLHSGYAGIPEPIKFQKNEMGVEEGDSGPLDLIIVPGVAFDVKGNRLGFGKGFYDHFLKRYSKTLKIGLAFFEQVVDSIPHDPYDVAMNVVITDQRIYFVSSKP